MIVGDGVPGVPAGRAKSLLPGRSCHQSVPRNRLVTEEECGRQCNVFGYVKTSTWASSSWRHRWRSVIFCGLSGSRPHSSPDPLPRATLPPGEGIFPDAVGIGGTARWPFPTAQKDRSRKWERSLIFQVVTARQMQRPCGHRGVRRRRGHSSSSAFRPSFQR